MHARHVVVATVTAVALILAAAGAVPALEVGNKAPDFSLAAPGSTPPKMVKLSELTAKGPVVLYTFIQAFTGT